MFQIHPASSLVTVLDRALGWLANNQSHLGDDFFDALVQRICLRQQLLKDMDRKPDEYIAGESGYGWKLSAEFADKVAKSHHLASPANWAWSMSVQRKLASQVPPRQIVEFEFGKAIETLKGMCSDIMSLIRILDYESPGNLMVRTLLVRISVSGHHVDYCRRFFTISCSASTRRYSIPGHFCYVCSTRMAWSCGGGAARILFLRT